MKLLMQMLTPQNVLLLTAGIVILRMSYEYLHRKSHRFAAFLIGTGSGIASLLLAHYYGGMILIHFSPPLTLYTLFVAAAGGIPGVLLLYVMQLLQ